MNISDEEKGSFIIQEINYGGTIIRFKKDQELKIEYSKYSGEDFITIKYDFGLTSKESYNIKDNWLLHGYRDLNEDSSAKEIAKKTVMYDVEHAFLHVSEDPNYGDNHWAIKGWLKDRVEMEEIPFYDQLVSVADINYIHP